MLLVRSIFILAILVCPAFSKDPAPGTSTAASYAEKLEQRLAKFDEVKAESFGDALERLRKLSGLNIIIDETSFAQGDGNPLQNEVNIPEMRDVRVSTILNIMLRKVNGEYHIEPDHILLVTANRKQSLTQRTSTRSLPNLIQTFEQPPGDGSEDETRFYPCLTIEFKEKALGDALKLLATKANRNIIISADAQKKAETIINASFTNTPFDVCTSSLAEMAGLRAAKNGNVIVIITAERFDKLVKAEVGPGINNNNFGITENLYSLDQIEQIGRIFSNKPADSTAEIKKLKAEKEALQADYQRIQDTLNKLQEEMKKLKPIEKK